MWLNNLRIPGVQRQQDILIEGEKIIAIGDSAQYSRPNSLSLDDAIAWPGMINSHDHLDFNLFPPLGNRIYNNYTEWGKDIHTHNKNQIAEILKIPQHLRTQWGMYKNLLNGFTTVVNHGEKLSIPNPLINVYQDCYNLHSVGFEKNWRWKLNKPGKSSHPIVLHVGEGTDDKAKKEINDLLRWNLFKRTLIGVHGVAMDTQQAQAFKALVWCPASNYFLLDHTAPIQKLKEHVPILFGTDSTLTASWNSWEQIRQARRENAATDTELFDMLTHNPAKAWNLKGLGELKAGSQADLVIARPSNTTASTLDSFFATNPEDILLIFHKGAIRLFDQSLTGKETPSLQNFYKIKIGNSIKYVEGNLPELQAQILHYAPGYKFPRDFK